MQKHVKKLFLLSQLQHIVNIDTRKIFYSAHIKAYIDYESGVWDDCGQVHFKKNEKTKNIATPCMDRQAN